MPAKKQAKRKADGEDEKNRRMLVIIILVSAAILVGAYILNRPSVQTYSVSGVKVTSEIPLSELQKRTYISLYNTTKSKAELTCKFELSAISTGDPRGYRIRIEQGDAGIYLGKKEAVIRGSTEQEILNTCHVFACMRDNITCPGNFLEMKMMVEKADSVAVVLDANAGAEGGKGYAEIIGALSYIQASIVDKNRDGIMNQAEIDNNTFFIYPFLKENGSCTQQPLHNLVENLSKSNLSRDCNMEDAIYLLNSPENRMRLEGARIILSGDSDGLHTESIILRDVLAPGWIRRLYGLE